MGPEPGEEAVSNEPLHICAYKHAGVGRLGWGEMWSMYWVVMVGGDPGSGALRKAGMTKPDGREENLGILQQCAGPSLQWPTQDKSTSLTCQANMAAPKMVSVYHQCRSAPICPNLVPIQPQFSHAEVLLNICPT